METNPNREGERGVIPFRSGRFFVVENHWYFSTREGINKGPFVSKSAAEAQLVTFIDECKEFNQLFH